MLKDRSEKRSSRFFDQMYRLWSAKSKTIWWSRGKHTKRKRRLADNRMPRLLWRDSRGGSKYLRKSKKKRESRWQARRLQNLEPSCSSDRWDRLNDLSIKSKHYRTSTRTSATCSRGFGKYWEMLRPKSGERCPKHRPLDKWRSRSKSNLSKRLINRLKKR